MEHPPALLTSIAVELALDAAGSSDKPVAVAGVLGSEMVAAVQPHRMSQELAEHATRVAIAGCQLILARGQGSRIELMADVGATAQTNSSTWAVVECLPGAELAHGGRLGELCDELSRPARPRPCSRCRASSECSCSLSARADSVRGFPTPGIDSRTLGGTRARAGHEWRARDRRRSWFH